MAKSKSKPKSDAPVEDVIDTNAKAEQEAADLAKAEADAKIEKEKTDATTAPANKDSDAPETDTPAAASEQVDEVEVENVDTVKEVVEEADSELTAKELNDQLASNKDVSIKDVAKEHGNYLNLPQALRDAEASQEQIHTPTGTRRTPPMNPFMKIQKEREAKQVKSNVPTAAEMATKIEKELKVNVADHFVLGSIVSKLNTYITTMAPNVQVGEVIGGRWQAELAKCFFEALSATPEASVVSLKILEMYFTEYRAHVFARSHAFRFMDQVRLNQEKLIAFQSLLHLFVELGNKDGRTKNEIQRSVNIGKIAESISDNADAQVRLIEFLN